MEEAQDTTRLNGDTLPVRKTRRRHRKQLLLTRESLDGRSTAAKLFDRLIGDIESDLGGHDQLSAIELALVEAFAGAAVLASDLNTRLALGQQIDVGSHSTCISAMVRVASRLGIHRRTRDVTPSLSQYLQQQPDDVQEAEAS